MALATTSIGGDRHGPLQPSWHRGARGHHGPLEGPRGVSRIAREVGRDKSTVSREIARNGWAASTSPRRVYRAPTAQARADARRLACRRPRALDDPARRSLVASLIRDRHWSPEQVAGRMRAEAPSEAVSASTIRRAVGSGALDCELPGWQSMRRRRARTEDIDEGMAGGGSNTLAFICS
ncbi:transposase [Tractidigestivibacter scatoligenes]|uniref:transposase n=1 Tax=Tractidigestivibacter scatoligenes TaxID=1299998 RepID=UPI003FCD1ACC